MTVTYRLEPRDLRAFHGYALRNLPNLRRIRYLAPTVVVGSCLWLALSAKEQDLNLPPGPHTGFRVFYFCVLSLIFLAWWRGLEFLLLRLVQWRSYTSDKNRAVLCEHTVTLSSDAFVEVTPFNEAKNLWGGIYRVTDTKDYIYVFTSVNSAHIIQKRAFADPESARRFYENAVALRAAAQLVAV